jgi:hypothetical protein
MKSKPNYYANIPATVRYDKSLTPNAKLLYAEITSLCNMNRKCCASTGYFMELYEVSRVSIQKWLKLLEDKNYIKRTIIYKGGSKQIETRYITLINNPSKQKLTDNTNININNTNITYSNRKQSFKEDVFNSEYLTELCEEFFDYWTEPNKSKTKMRFELQKTWDLNRRLKTWYNNEKKFNKQPMSKIGYQINEWQKAKKGL